MTELKKPTPTTKDLKRQAMQVSRLAYQKAKNQ